MVVDLPNQHGTRLSTAELDYQNQQQVLFTTTHLESWAGKDHTG
jgi:hypothetical protein